MYYIDVYQYTELTGVDIPGLSQQIAEILRRALPRAGMTASL